MASFRRQWYQTPQYVTLEVFAKGLQGCKERVKTRLEERTLELTVEGENPASSSASAPTQSGQNPPGGAHSTLLHLFGRIVPSESTVDILSTKIEFKLIKADGSHWADFEDPTHKKVVEAEGDQKTVDGEASGYKKKTPKDWSKLDAELEESEKDEKLEGDAALQKLFQDIYAKADDETKKAMMKSFQESNGTVLSTNWQEVGKKQVEVQAPDGMEVKKYEQ